MISPQRYAVSRILLGALLSLGPAMSAMADGMSCGSGLVHDGDDQAKALRLCGEPAKVEKRFILRRPQVWVGGRLVYVGHDEVEVPVEIWTYNFGPNKLMRRLKIVDGVIEEIETLGYGYHER